jgi:hypothetical protein
MSARIIDIASRQQRYTVDDLMAEARSHVTGFSGKRDFNKFLDGVPEQLRFIAGCIMADFDYRQAIGSDVAVGLRGLVSIAVLIEDHLAR